MQQNARRRIKDTLMKNSRSKTHIIDADGHVRETDEEIIEYMSGGYRARRAAMLYFPLTHTTVGIARSRRMIFVNKIFACRTGANGSASLMKAVSS